MVEFDTFIYFDTMKAVLQPFLKLVYSGIWSLIAVIFDKNRFQVGDEKQSKPQP